MALIAFASAKGSPGVSVTVAGLSHLWPRPTVGSVVVRLDRRATPLVAGGEDALWRVVDGAFAQRRKTVRNAVRRLGFGASETAAILARAGVDGDARPEILPLASFAAIAEALPA